MNVLRRITAILAMAAIIGLLAMLVWEVEMHHQRGAVPDEPVAASVPHNV
jgi:cytosine/uracil/thiamine/allantoin permease